MFAISTSALVTALTLCATLTGVRADVSPTCTDTHSVQKGETCQSIAKGSGITSAYFTAINPGIDCKATLAVNTEVCVYENSSPECTKTVKANSTNCGQVAAHNGISGDQLLSWNLQIDGECSNLKKGENVCVMVLGCYKSASGGLVCGG